MERFQEPWSIEEIDRRRNFWRSYWQDIRNAEYFITGHYLDYYDPELDIYLKNPSND